MCTRSHLKEYTPSIVNPFRLHCASGSFKMDPLNISFVFCTLNFIAFLVDCWTRSSTNDCIELTDDRCKTSVIVVLSINSSVTQPVLRLISMMKVNGPKNDPETFLISFPTTNLYCCCRWLRQVSTVDDRPTWRSASRPPCCTQMSTVKCDKLVIHGVNSLLY